ncbi:MAG: alpha/beta hydrolase, partial [Cyanobacteria bacterium J06627_3]
YDAVVNSAKRWQPLLKPSDRIWTCPQGHHFFHFDQPRLVETAILNYWQQIDRLEKTADLSAVLNH